MLISSVSRPEHLDLFEQKIAATLDLAYAGPQSVRIAQMVEDGKVEIGAIHTYVELYARMFTDLTPERRAVCATKADRDGNLYTGPNTEDTPTIAEATAFRDGVVIAQADEIVDDRRAPAGRHPGDWVDLVVEADRPFALEPLFTRDPRLIEPVEILMAMIAIRGVYERHQVTSLNHGIGFDTAAIELLLPTYGEPNWAEGQDRQALDAQPASDADPGDRIAAGWNRSTASAARPGMERYTAARPDVFFTGRDGSLRSNRVLCQLAGQYAVDMFIGSSLQIDRDANSSTVTDGRLPGFGGAPNMGHDPHGRRHSSAAWLSLAHGEAYALRGRKLVVQIAQTFQKGGIPTFVESLDAVEVGKNAGMPIPPVMIYGDDVSHVVTEEGVAYLYKAPSLSDRRAALSAIAGVTPIGLGADAARTEQLRRDGLGGFSGRPRYRCAASGSVAAGRTQHRGPRRMVRRTLRSARTVSGLVSAMTNAANATALRRLSAERIADAAVGALFDRGAAHAETRAGRRSRHGTATPT